MVEVQMGEEGIFDVGSCEQAPAGVLRVEVVSRSCCGVRTVPLSFKSAVKLIQFVGQMQVVHRVGGCRFVVGYLSVSQTDTGLVLKLHSIQSFSLSHCPL